MHAQEGVAQSIPPSFKDFFFTQPFLSALVLVLSLLPFPLCLCCPAVSEAYCVIYILIISSCSWWATGEH